MSALTATRAVRPRAGQDGCRGARAPTFVDAWAPPRARGREWTHRIEREADGVVQEARLVHRAVAELGRAVSLGVRRRGCDQELTSWAAARAGGRERAKAGLMVMRLSQHPDVCKNGPRARARRKGSPMQKKEAKEMPCHHQ